MYAHYVLGVELPAVAAFNEAAGQNSAGSLDSIADPLSALRSNKQDRLAWSRNGVPRPSASDLVSFFLKKIAKNTTTPLE